MHSISVWLSPDKLKNEVKLRMFAACDSQEIDSGINQGNIGALTKNKRNKELPNDFYPFLLHVILKLPGLPNLTQELNPFPIRKQTQEPRQSPNDHV
jgi:hypothetical protein